MKFVKPFLSWAGNKYHVLDKILPFLGKGNRFLEPFLGSGAVFLNTNYERYILGDVNPDLMNLYRTLQSHGLEFIDFCESFFSRENNREDRYYELRNLFNTTSDSYLKSALFVYLNKHGYNGLCRYNRYGRLNVAYGYRRRPYFPRREMMDFYSKLKSSDVRFCLSDFEHVMDMASSGDVVYCDPPYILRGSDTASVCYARSRFTTGDLARLLRKAVELSREGVSVVISNLNESLDGSLRGFIGDRSVSLETFTFNVRRTISCDGRKRCRVSEILVAFRQRGVCMPIGQNKKPPSATSADGGNSFCSYSRTLF